MFERVTIFPPGECVGFCLLIYPVYTEAEEGILNFELNKIIGQLCELQIDDTAIY